MAWEDVELMVDVGSRLKSVLNAKPLFRFGGLSLPKPMDHDRIEEAFDVEGDQEEFGIVKKEAPEILRSGIFSTPARFPSGLDCRPAGAKVLDDEYILFPTYEDAPRRTPRSGKLAIIDNSSTSPELDLIMSQDTVDDTYLQHPPTRHVDYLSHEWVEEDIWASWRQVISERHDRSTHLPRLENASWRMWAKTRSKLETLPAEAINWIKDEDVTWLYGPLHTARTWNPKPFSTPSIEQSVEVPKPILKIPSLEKVLLQRSISDLALVRHSSPANSSRTSSRSTSPMPLATKSQTLSPTCLNVRTKNVSFHDEVAQCVAISTEHILKEQSITCQEEVYLTARQRPSRANVRRSSSPLTSLKTIECLPPTTLKPEAIPPQPLGAFERAKSWPSRTLSYLWDQATAPKLPESIPITEAVRSQSPPEPKSTFEDDEEDQVDWNPPRPRRFPVEQECKVMSTMTDMPQPQTQLLTDEESFEIEMFGCPLNQKSPKISFPSEDELEIHSNRSSPSISEYLSSSSEDLEELDFTPSIFRVAGLSLDGRGESRTPSPCEDSDSSSAMSENIQVSRASRGVGLGIHDEAVLRQRSNHFFTSCNPSSIYSSPPVKDRLVPSTCSSELNAIYGGNSAAQRPMGMDAGMAMDDEEYWWANV